MKVNYIKCCDCVDGMKELPNESIDLVVTSPPYDNLRTYNGYSFNSESVAEQLFRVIKQGGVVVWVVGDATIKGSETGTSFKQALYFKQIGFRLHDTMIWIKDGGGAVGSNKCYTQNFEYMFVFSKGAPKSINLIYDKPNQSFGQNKSGIGRRKKNGDLKIETRKSSKEFSRRNNWWYIPVGKTKDSGGHSAVFPEQLANDHIISWSNVGDIVLDPFMGSGTTAKMAMLNDRKYIGFECSQEYVDIANARISSVIKDKQEVQK